MRLISLSAFILFLLSCGQKPASSTQTMSATDSLVSALKKVDSIYGDQSDTLSENEEFSDFEDYYVLIADTGKNYWSLRNKMEELSAKYKLKIDTMGRSYNAKKDLIALADNDEDEMYAGDYYPRRFPSTHLSLEYLDLYQKKAGEKTIALVAGIFENKKSADSLLAIIKPSANKSFVIKSAIYVGCLH